MTKWLPLLCLGWTALARAGVRIESTVTAYEGQPVDTILELQGDDFRVDRNDPAHQRVPRTTIFDGTRMIVMNSTDKTYDEITLDDLKTRLAQLDQLKANLPPEARAEIDRQSQAPTYAFKRTSGGEKVAGIACENYQITKDGKDQGRACLTNWKGSALVTKADLAPIKKLIDTMKSMSKLSSGDLEMGQFEKWPGWPLIMWAPDGHELSRVTRISRVEFPAKEFQAPTDFTRKAIPQMMGGGHP